MRLLMLTSAVLTVWYFAWLLQPARVGDPYLYGLLLVAELFNLVQGVGFWWTCAFDRPRPRPPAMWRPEVDVLIPTYNESVEIVEPTVAAAVALSGARVRVFLLDDGARPAMRALAARHGAGYLQREANTGAKAGNLNHALRRTDGTFVLVLDCDHVPRPEFLLHTLGSFVDPRVAFVQTPQYYANAQRNRVARAAWAQQALFFGPIARGKDALGATFCCGTNVVFRRDALASVGGFPESSLTEDFELSIHLHASGWKSVYVPRVLASGLGPEDMASYVSQQYRWARGCLGGLRTVLRARLPWRVRLQYLLSGVYFLTGWTTLVYIALPAVRIVTGAQPLAATTADQFLLHFTPYFLVALFTVALAGAGSYTFAALALATASFWIHIHATFKAVFRRPGRFVVTPKKGTAGRQPRSVAPTLGAVILLSGAAVYGLLRDRDPGTLNNVAFACLHIGVLLAGAWPALRSAGPRAAAATRAPVPAMTSEVAPADLAEREGHARLEAGREQGALQQ